MARNRREVYQHPLDRFLALAEGEEDSSRLNILASRMAHEQFDADTYRAALVNTLKRLRYPQPLGRLPAKTFHEILEQGGVLQELLREDTLKELWKSELVSKILAESDALESGKRSVEEIPLAEHRRRRRRIEKDVADAERIADTYSLAGMDEFYSPLYRLARREIDTMLVSTRYVGSKERLLAGQPSASQRRSGTNNDAARQIRSVDIAIQVMIYRTLEPRLQNAETRKKGISDIFLCQLSELVWRVWHPPTLPLTSGETLRRAVKRLPK